MDFHNAEAWLCCACLREDILCRYGVTLHQAPPFPQAHYLQQLPLESPELHLPAKMRQQGAPPTKVPFSGPQRARAADVRPWVPPQTQSYCRRGQQLHAMLTRDRRHGSWGFREQHRDWWRTPHRETGGWRWRFWGSSSFVDLLNFT